LRHSVVGLLNGHPSRETVVYIYIHYSSLVTIGVTTDSLCSAMIAMHYFYIIIIIIIIIYYATRAAHTHTTAYNHIHQHTQNYILKSIKTQKKTKNELHA